MNDQPRFLTDPKRDSLRARIEAAERRNVERSLADSAREAAQNALDYTRAHPLTVIGGALAVGLAIGLLTRPGRRAALRVAHTTGEAVSGAAATVSSGAKNLAARGGSRIGTLLGEAAVGYIMTLIDDAVEAARNVPDQAEEMGETVTAKARTLARKSRESAGRAVAGIRRKTKG
jgi:hypothetical protein